MTEHNHSHEHEGHEHITLVDDQGNETLYEILLTVDGQEEFGRNYDTSKTKMEQKAS